MKKELFSQEKMILIHLESGSGITAKDAFWQYGCLRLAARIFDLREKGYNIHTEMVRVGKGKEVAFYKLITPKK